MNSQDWLDFLGLFFHIAGFILGLGAVTVIDFHGFLGRTSPYWTEAATRTHKITKPLIWVGLILAIAGGLLFYRHDAFTPVHAIQVLLALVLILNGLYLTFFVSPHLLRRETLERSNEILSKTWQSKIMASFLLSFFGWWIEFVLLIFHLAPLRRA